MYVPHSKIRTLAAVALAVAVVVSVGIGLLVQGVGETSSHASGRASEQPVVSSPRTLHYINNMHGQTAEPVALGYNLFDVGPNLSPLPSTGKALVWVGQKCPAPPNAAWKATINRLAQNPRVFGYFLSDEPSDAACAGGMRAEADYIKAASGGKQISFVVLLHPADYVAFRPAVTHVSLIGLDPYPKSINGFQISDIADKVLAAEAAGIPVADIVPTYEAFGQEHTANPYYLMPTAAETQAILSEWQSLVPDPVFDYTYTWGHQTDANPTLADSPADQAVYKAWNGGHP